jgi:hypothetical protein
MDPRRQRPGTYHLQTVGRVRTTFDPRRNLHSHFHSSNWALLLFRDNSPNVMPSPAVRLLIFPMLETAAAADLAGMDGIRADDKNADFENRSSRTPPELPRRLARSCGLTNNFGPGSKPRATTKAMLAGKGVKHDRGIGSLQNAGIGVNLI